MALINYLTRIHFADGVLEEALRSEMEQQGKRRPMVVAEQAHLEGGIGERLYSGLPIRTKVRTFTDVPRLVTEDAAERVAAEYREGRCDLLIAFGGNRAIDLAKVARVTIAYEEPVGELSSEEGGAHRIGEDLPDLFAVPNIGGFSSAVSDYARVKLKTGEQALLSSRHLIPTVTICDPTVTLGSSPVESASAAAGVISRAIDAYLARAYNPPADGLALDALTRIVSNVGHVLQDDDLGARREMMAGSLNSALSLQKGLCAVHAITNALAAVSETAIDHSAAGRLILPLLVAAYGPAVNGKSETLKRSLGMGGDVRLSDGLVDLMRGFPLPDRLSGMGFRKSQLRLAASHAFADRAIRNGPRPLGEGEIRDILYGAY